MKSDLKRKLKTGESILGTMIIAFDNPELAKILKVVGFDFFIVDCEHGPFDFGAILGLFSLAREAGIPPMIRIPEVTREWVLKSMEMGAAGILLPQTESVEQAKALVAYSKYAPMGTRGVSMMRAHTGFEKIANASEYMNQQNEDSLLMVQIESHAGVDAVEDIMAVSGIDVAFVGPNDLTQSLGISGQFDHPKFIAALDRIISVAKVNNKYSGIHLMDPVALTPWIDRGMSCNLWSNDVAMLMESARKGLTDLRRSVSTGSGR